MEKFNKFLKTAALGIGLITAKEAESKNLNNITNKDLENRNSIVEDSTGKGKLRDTSLKKGNIAVYTESKTKEGGITPTGLSNSFLENNYGVTVDDLDSIARHYGFRNDNEKNFQEDMIMYALKHKPELIDKVLKEFGSTNYGEKNNLTDYRMLLDAKLGRRAAYIMAELKKEIEEKKTGEKQKSTEQTVSKTREENPKEYRVFNLDGIDKLYILFDASESMEAHKDALIKDLKKSKFDLPVEFSRFTKQIESTDSAINIEQASKILKDAKPSSERLELGVDVIISKMEGIEDKDSNKLVVLCTDEELQKVTKEKLERIKKLEKEKNIKVQFTMMFGGVIRSVGVDYLLEVYDYVFAKDIDARVKERMKEIKGREGYLDELMEDLGKAKDKKTQKRIMNNIKEAQEDLARYKDGLERIKEFSISGYDHIDNRISKKQLVRG